MATKKITPKTGTSELFSDIKVNDGSKRRPLNETEKEALIAMFAVKENSAALDISNLVPKGSFIQRMLRHFDDTDISYLLPLFQLIMLASSWLTQNGAQIHIPGLGSRRPILWTVALAASAQAKTVSTDRVSGIMSPEKSVSPVAMFPKAGSDAQWIVDLQQNNGSYWFQDEVGQYFSHVLRTPSYARMKPWLLDAYTHAPISNRLKSENIKLTVDDPHFTFFGLSVRETWKDNIDAASMADGFCQRFNYVIADKRDDTDMFDHFLYFTGEDVDTHEKGLRDLWMAICDQPNATGDYHWNSDVLPYLKDWWRSLRPKWGDCALPASFTRRTGFSVLSYLVVVQFLLGKSKSKIDIETAEIATKYAEFHLESALQMMREYGSRNVSHVRQVSETRGRLISKGKLVNTRNIQRSLSKKSRTEISSNMTAQILDVLERIDVQPDLFDGVAYTPKEKSAVLMKRRTEVEDRLTLNERKRNERRLRNLLSAYRASEAQPQPVSDDSGDGCEVLDITDHLSRVG